jgi:hypothetical protein
MKTDDEMKCLTLSLYQDFEHVRDEEAIAKLRKLESESIRLGIQIALGSLPSLSPSISDHPRNRIILECGEAILQAYKNSRLSHDDT